MQRSLDRILTTHVGSLVRPVEFLRAAQHAARLPEAYAESLTAATKDVVARQARAGIDVVNDGEYGKSSWANYVLDRMTGFEPRPDTGITMNWRPLTS